MGTSSQPRCARRVWWSPWRSTSVPMSTPRSRLRITANHIVDASALPWHRVQGSADASTMWFAVMRRRERGVDIGTLVLRHGDHHTLLAQRGWEEVPIEEIAAPAAGRVDQAM